jgi:hypothetical protein
LHIFTFTDREEIHKEKQTARTKVSDFLKDCPPEYEQLMRNIDALNFGDPPDYQALIGILESVSLKIRIYFNFEF